MQAFDRVRRAPSKKGTFQAVVCRTIDKRVEEVADARMPCGVRVDIRRDVIPVLSVRDGSELVPDSYIVGRWQAIDHPDIFGKVNVTRSGDVVFTPYRSCRRQARRLAR